MLFLMLGIVGAIATVATEKDKTKWEKFKNELGQSDVLHAAQVILNGPDENETPPWQT